jgi:cation-transporting ATPase E
LLSNTIRENARETFSFFARQGVAIKVISGDNPMTVSHIAKKAGIEGADNYVDAMTLNTETKIKAAAKKYTIFGRVTPEQKRKLIRALRADGNIVAMTGDGVNDVLALKDADCSIAMASGSEVASQVSHLVLLDSDFSSMPSVVMEGRRVINNIQRSAALFLVKNIFSFTLAIITMLFPIPYPVTPAQLSMVSTLTIGIPSFFLALEPNTAIVKGRFLKNVLFRALPGGLTDVILVLTAMAFTYAFDLELSQLSTISAILLAVVGFMVLIRVCRPFTTIRKAVCVMVAVALVFSVIFLRDLFALQPIDIRGALVLAVLAALSYPLMEGFAKLQDSIAGFFTKRRNRKKILDGRFKP